MSSSFTTGSFTASGQSTEIPGSELMTLSISGFGSATVELERSFDAGVTWVVIDSYTANTETNVVGVSEKFLWRLDCTWTSGTIVYAFGK